MGKRRRQLRRKRKRERERGSRKEGMGGGERGERFPYPVRNDCSEV